MLTVDQKNVFEELLKSDSFKGKETLKHLLWLNTTEPKFHKGDCFQVTEKGRYIFGVRVVNFNAAITRVLSYKTDNEYWYELEGIVKRADGKESSFQCRVLESDLVSRADSNVTVLQHALSDCPDETQLSLEDFI